jgi:hypothetical protein
MTIALAIKFCFKLNWLDYFSDLSDKSGRLKIFSLFLKISLISGLSPEAKFFDQN